jgi:DNA-binding transcriptional ArsR family regulator
MAPTAAEPPPESLDPSMLKAIAHPLRYEILVRIRERGEASPVGIARALEQPVGRISHHVRTLARLGAIRLVRTERRRGAIEHFYAAVRTTLVSDDDWERLPIETRDALVANRLRRLLGDAGAAAQSGGFADAWSHLSYVRCELDAAGIAAMGRLLEETLRGVMAIEAESAARSADEPRTPTEVALLHFRRAPED